MTRRGTQMAHLADTPLLGAVVGLGEGERASLCAEVPKPDGGGTSFPRLLFLVLLVLVAVWSSATRGGGDAARSGLRRAERVASRSRTPSQVDLGAAACRPLAVCAPANGGLESRATCAHQCCAHRSPVRRLRVDYDPKYWSIDSQAS